VVRSGGASAGVRSFGRLAWRAPRSPASGPRFYGYVNRGDGGPARPAFSFRGGPAPLATRPYGYLRWKTTPTAAACSYYYQTGAVEDWQLILVGPVPRLASATDAARHVLQRSESQGAALALVVLEYLPPFVAPSARQPMLRPSWRRRYEGGQRGGHWISLRNSHGGRPKAVGLKGRVAGGRGTSRILRCAQHLERGRGLGVLPVLLGATSKVPRPPGR